MFTVKKLSRKEKLVARRLGVSAADVHFTCCTCYGNSYTLYNDYYDTFIITDRSDKAEIYRLLLRQLFKKLGILEKVAE